MGSVDVRVVKLLLTIFGLLSGEGKNPIKIFMDMIKWIYKEASFKSISTFNLPVPS